jgi:hypothetical protein
MALRPIQERAVCARWPGTTISARSVPWHPPSISAELGSISTAKSPSRSSGLLLLSRSSPLRSAATSSQS